MPPELSAAQLLLESARRDLAAVEALLDNTAIHDSTIGFHAQQTVEKALKAVLSAKGVVFRRTHDLAELLDLIADSQITAPLPPIRWMNSTPMPSKHAMASLTSVG